MNRRFWPHAVALAIRKFLPDHDDPSTRKASTEWAKNRAVTLSEALIKLGICNNSDSIPVLPADVIAEGKILAEQSRFKMGGAGALNLLFGLTKLLKACRIVETGVAYGWSSLAFLAAIKDTPDSILLSVDMPYVKANNERWVGVVVPGYLRAKWTLIREPDRYGLIRAIGAASGPIDLCHYDSDKSYWGRKWAYPILWDALCSGGVFISDDIQSNFGFKEFVEKKGVLFSIIENEGKYVGIFKKT